VATGRPVTPPLDAGPRQAHLLPVDACFSGDGKFVAVVFRDGFLGGAGISGRVYEVATALPLMAAVRLPDWPDCIAGPCSPTPTGAFLGSTYGR
jgi:hypothetical protein